MMTTLAEFNTKVDAIMAKEREAVARFFAAAEKHALASRRGRVVVYVEDDPDQVSILKTLFAKYSRFRVEPATTAEQGKILLSARVDRVRCVILDIALHGADTEGLDLLRWIRENYPRVPVIVLSAKSNMADRVHQEFPGVDFMLKASQSNEALVDKVVSKAEA